MKLSHVLRFHWGTKDGGPESKVYHYGIESKLFGSLLLLKFEEGSRDAFHSHAFNSLSWVLTGRLWERQEWLAWYKAYVHYPSFRPVRTYRETMHQVYGWGNPNSWVLTLRGPWVATWHEFLPRVNRYITLTHGRKEVRACRG